jgi:beta-lactamase regulating signal transducer with metallopeptidase domain
MPVLMQVGTIQIPVRAAPSVRTLAAAKQPTSIPISSTPSPVEKQFPWAATVTALYLAVSGVLLARLLFGLGRAWQIRRAAVPHQGDWTDDIDIRVSSSLRMPVTIGSTILLPQDVDAWDGETQRAVLAHERAHVTNSDSLVLSLASLHRAIFWMSPLAWWLQWRLADLAEAISDEAALHEISDRPSYAELLMDLAQRVHRFSGGVAMARASTVVRRIERILGGSRVAMPLEWRHRAILSICAIPVVALIGGSNFAQPIAAADSQDPYVIVSGGSVTMSGSSDDVVRARSIPNKPGSDYVWFLHAGEPYMISDPAFVRRAKDLFKPQEELGRRQAELGDQQAKLGEQQARLGALQSNVKVPAPSEDALLNLEKELQRMRAKIKESKGELEQEELSELQARIGELQSKFGDAQSKAGEKQAALGAEQSELGELQSKLGAQQSQLGEQQSRLAEEASQKMRSLLDEAVRTGTAHRVK